MDIPSTLTDIANLALTSIGEDTITSIDAETARARKVRVVLYQNIREVQRLIDWPELRVRKTLTQHASMLTDTIYKYLLPTNFLEVISTDDDINWFLQDSYFCTGSSTAEITYKKYSQEPSEWSADLVEMVYRKVAVSIAPLLTENAQWMQTASAIYDRVEQRCITQTQNRKRNIQRYSFNSELVHKRLYNGRYPYYSR